MEFAWSDDEAAFRQELRDFLAAELPEHWFTLVPGEEPASQFTFDFCAKLGKAGLLAPHWPREYGGRDASGWQFIVLGEELWRAGEPRGAQYMNVNWIGPAIMAAGTAEQKDYHLNRITAGDIIWCQGFSEPQAGTDLAALAATAVGSNGEYTLNGVKIWTSYAQWAHYCFVLARTDPTSTGTRGISIFMVPTGLDGFVIEPISTVLDIHVVHRLTFSDVKVDRSMLLGEENNGWEIIRDALAHERIGGPRYARSEMVLDQLRERAQQNGQWADRGIRAQFGKAQADIDAARILAYQVIDDRVKGRPNGTIVNLARVAIVRAERGVAEVAFDLMGSDSLRLGSIGNSQFKTSMIAGLGGGSAEVQLNLISRALLGSEGG
ncbi:MAG: acyl-CoA dehydrogenase family protein [Acidimicrobiia bacterium]